MVHKGYGIYLKDVALGPTPAALFEVPAREILPLRALAVLAACSAPDPNSQFFREAGSQLDTGSFGNATMNNVLVHSQQRDAMVALSSNFAAAGASTPAAASTVGAMSMFCTSFSTFVPGLIPFANFER